MTLAIARPSAPARAVFKDGLGERHHVSDRSSGDPVEILHLRDELTTAPAFEFALRERVHRLASFQHACVARVRGIERADTRPSTLAIVSDVVPGIRLSHLLIEAEQRGLALEINAALFLLRQLVPAVALLHEDFPDIAHGALAPERMVVTPHARLVIVEHVLGSALEQLHYSQAQYWQQLRIAVPRTPAPGPLRFDHRADVAQIGAVGLALILGRALGEHEYPDRVRDALGSAWAVASGGSLEPLPSGLRAWLARALQLDAHHSFASAIEAQSALDEVLDDSGYIAAPAALESFLAKLAERRPAPPLLAEPKPAPKSETPPAQKLGAPVVAKVESPKPVAQVPQSPEVGASKPAPVMPKLAKSSEVAVSKPVPLAPRAPEVEMPPIAQPSPAWRRRGAVAALLLIGLASSGLVAFRHYVTRLPAAAQTAGTLVVNTNPSGVLVAIDGQQRGTTPLTLTLNPGPHNLELRAGDAVRTIPLTIASGAESSQYIELIKSGTTQGRLQIRAEPSGARVAVDGEVRGVAPLTIDDLAPGVHKIVVDNDFGSVAENVTIEPGVTATIVVPLTAPQGAPVSGWISVSAPVELQLYEDGRLLGSSRNDRVLMTAGRHDIEVVSEPLGYRATRTVQVAAGKLSPIKLDWPKGAVALNALPWAEVWIDGERIGETPIGNVSVGIGPHEIVFRHPELGEQKYATTITLAAPVRLSADMRKK